MTETATELRMLEGSFGFTDYDGGYELWEYPLVRIYRIFAHMEKLEFMTLSTAYSYVVLPNES